MPSEPSVTSRHDGPRRRSKTFRWLDAGVYAGKTLFGVGILVATFCGLPFFLGSYGGGGVAEAQGGTQKAGRRYVLFNHGTVTVISEEYYRLLQEVGGVKRIHDRIALPLLLVGVLAYGLALHREEGRFGRAALARILLPNLKDPLVAFVGKTYFLLMFVALFTISVAGQDWTEAEHVSVVVWTYVCLLFAALAIAGGVQLTSHARSRSGTSRPPTGGPAACAGGNGSGGAD